MYLSSSSVWGVEKNQKHWHVVWTMCPYLHVKIKWWGSYQNRSGQCQRNWLVEDHCILREALLTAKTAILGNFRQLLYKK